MAMTEEERAVLRLQSTFEEELARGRLQASGLTASERIELLNAALGWEDQALRIAAADAIEATLKHLPWSKKSRAERTEKVGQLRKAKE